MGCPKVFQSSRGLAGNSDWRIVQLIVMKDPVSLRLLHSVQNRTNKSMISYLQCDAVTQSGTSFHDQHAVVLADYVVCVNIVVSCGLTRLRLQLHIYDH